MSERGNFQATANQSASLSQWATGFLTHDVEPVVVIGVCRTDMKAFLVPSAALAQGMKDHKLPNWPMEIQEKSAELLHAISEMLSEWVVGPEGNGAPASPPEA